ncbi:M1 family aminopeptidase [Jatrophihabitans sp. YIM 134969]
MRSSGSADARPGRRAALAAAAAACLLAGCTATVDGSGSARRTAGPAASGAPTDPSSAAPSSPSATTSPQPANGCATYTAPDPDRPVLDLKYVLAADHASVEGVETIAFTPDAQIDRLVFRLTANTAPSVQEGNRIQVTAAEADHGGGAATYERAGADPDTQGGLLTIPFADPVAAGTTVTARISFTTTLGQGSFDRFGRQEGFAWWASAHPLLAWERGYGWHDEPLIQFTAESATSEAMDTTLTVTAPAADVVIMSGNPTTSSGSGSTRTWSAQLDAARDVSVAAGPFETADATVDIGGGRSVALRIGAPSSALVSELQPEFERALTGLSRQFGPFPFPSLAVARLPASGGGIEYPGAILMLDGSRLVAVHETAHQWFYAMVGNSQAQHAWLDEAFASFGEQVLDSDPPPPAILTTDDTPVDKPTADYGDDVSGYYSTTYDKGSAALFAARAAAGAPAFDAAIQCYVAENAWTVADPADLQKALADLPAAVRVLQQAGALAR